MINKGKDQVESVEIVTANYQIRECSGPLTLLWSISNNSSFNRE